MNRRLCLRVLASGTISTLFPGATYAAPLQNTPQQSAEPGKPDPLYAQAVAVVMTNKKASISLVQRHLKIGYNHAARLVDGMMQAGLISSFDVNGLRHILAPGGSLVY